jgi:hypothetical protein
METTQRRRLTRALSDHSRPTDRHRDYPAQGRGRHPFRRLSPATGGPPLLPRRTLTAVGFPLCLLILLILSLFSTKSAAGFSGNADEPRALSRYSDDPRLDKSISLIAWAEPLEDVLARLSRDTGIELTFLGRDVGDQRVTAVLKDQPLRRAQALLAETLGLSWMRESHGSAYRYILFEDARSRKEEEALRDRARRQFEQGLRRVVDSLNWSPEEVAKRLPKGSDWASWLGQPFRRTAFGMLGILSPPAWQQLMQTGQLSIPFDQLSPENRRVVLKYVDEANQHRLADDLEQGTPGRHHLGDVTQPGGKIGFNVFGGAPPGPDSSLDFVIDPSDGHHGGSGLGLGYTPEELRRLREEDTPPPFQRAKGAEPEPGPRVTVTWKQKPDRWEEVLKAVVEGGHLQVVSDSYLYHWWEWNMDLPDAAALHDRPLSEVLDKIAVPFLYVWRRDSDVYLFRQRNWYLEKQHNVPERDLRRWRKHLREVGRLELADLAELVLLTDRQLRNVDGAGVPVDAVRSHQSLLRLFAALTPLQKERLDTSGLALRDLIPAQTALLLAWKPVSTMPAGTRLRLRRQTDAAVFSLAADATVPQEERVPLEKARPAGGG